jgi:hypothetical protein
MAAMAGAIAAAFWGGVPIDIAQRVESLLSLDILDTINNFSFIYPANSLKSLMLPTDKNP